MNVTDAAYIAGLFDGEGSIDYAKRYKKIGNRRSLTWNILMRIQMTDESVLRWVHETLKVGTIRKKNRSPSIKPHWKDSWIYSIRYRQAYHVCKLLWPYAQVKLHKIEQIIDHYEPNIQDLDDNIVDLALERERRYDTVR